MAWTSPRTWVTGEIVTSALLNTHLRDNLLETAAAKVTTAGDLTYATGANALSRLGIGSSGRPLTVNAGANAPQWGDVLSMPLGSASAPPYSFTGDTNTGIWSSGADTIDVVTGGTDRWVFNSNGYFIPVTNNTYDIGATGALVRSVFATDVRIGATPALTGSLRLPNNGFISARNSANNSDHELLAVTNGSPNVVKLGHDIGLNTEIHCDDYIYFWTDGVSRVTIVSDRLYPSVDDTVYLGGLGNRWKAVYAINGTIQTSSRKSKENIVSVAPTDALSAILRTPIYSFTYRQSASDTTPAMPHIGFMAEEADAWLSPDRQSASPQTTASLALAAIQELNRRLEIVEAGRR